MVDLFELKEELVVTIQSIYAQLNVSNLEISQIWYKKLFGRPADATPMPGLIEWHHRQTAGLQVFENAKDAGHGTLTLIVSGLRGERKRLEDMGLSPGEIELATSTSLIRLRDPDNNLVVLAQAGSV